MKTFLLLAVAWRPAGELPRLEEAPALRALTHCDGRWGRACWATSAAELRRGFLDKRGRSVVDLPTDPPKEEEEEEEEAEEEEEEEDGEEEGGGDQEEEDDDEEEVVYGQGV